MKSMLGGLDDARARARQLRIRYGWRWWRLSRYKWTPYSPAVRGHAPRIGRSRRRRALVHGPGELLTTRARLVRGRSATFVRPASVVGVECIWSGPYLEEYAGRAWAGWWRHRLIASRQRRGWARADLRRGSYRPHPLQRGRTG